MKRFLVLAACLSLLGFQTGRSDFSGKWKLDLRKSQHLPSSFKGVDAYAMEVAQSGDSMIVKPTMTADTQHIALPPTIYKFDSSEVYREDTLRGSKRWIRSAWTTTGRKFIATTRAELTRGKSKQAYTERDVWQLKDRNTLQIFRTQTFVDPDSTHDEQRIFHRIKQ